MLLKQNGKLIKLVLDPTFQSFWCYLTKREKEDKGNRMDSQVEHSSGLQEYPDFKLYTCFLSLWPEIHQAVKKVVEGFISSLAVCIRTDYMNCHKNPSPCQDAFYTVAFESQLQSYADCLALYCSYTHIVSLTLLEKLSKWSPKYKK